jgi:hypothetical protein
LRESSRSIDEETEMSSRESSASLQKLALLNSDGIDVPTLGASGQMPMISKALSMKNLAQQSPMQVKIKNSHHLQNMNFRTMPPISQNVRILTRPFLKWKPNQAVTITVPDPLKV